MTYQARTARKRQDQAKAVMLFVRPCRLSSPLFGPSFASLELSATKPWQTPAQLSRGVIDILTIALMSSLPYKLNVCVRPIVAQQGHRSTFTYLDS